jgi:hypothetical protein
MNAMSDKKHNFRLIPCVDIAADTLEEAYGILRQGMINSGLEWETSDEWYKHGEDDAGDPRELQAAIIASFKKLIN